MSEKLFQNYTRGPAQSGVDSREISPLTGPLKPKPRPELQTTQPMHVVHAPNAGSKD
jgi:hypothetical protein